MHKVSRMTQTPATCLTCGRGNTPDDPDTMDDFWAIDLERDVNWGDPTYICKYCCDIFAAIAGFVSMDQLQEQMQIIQGLKKKLHNARAKLEARDRRLAQIASGAKALKKTKREQERKTKKVAA